jgi:hypothetical protein
MKRKRERRIVQQRDMATETPRRTVWLSSWSIRSTV